MVLHEHVNDLIPAFALGCLEPAEKEQVTGHLAECEQCRVELREYQEVTGELAYGPPQVQPPARLKAALLARVQRAAPTSQAAAGRARRRRWLDWLLRPAPGWAVGGMVLILLLAVGNVALWQQVGKMRAEQLQTPMMVIALQGTEAAADASGLIVVSQDGEHGTLVVDHLPQLQGGLQYQLWLVKDGQRTDGGVFSVGKDGYGALWVGSPDPLASYTAFGITIEPEGGSPGPTGAKVLGGNR